MAKRAVGPGASYSVPAALRLLHSVGFAVAMLHAGGTAVAAPPTVTISVDADTEYQTWFGFGATHQTLVYGEVGDVLSPSQRQRAVTALFEEVRLTTGQGATTFEAPASSTLENFFGAQANDDGDPASIDPNGFFLGLGDGFKAKVVDLAGGPHDLYADVKIGSKWAGTWLNAIHDSDYEKFLDECAEGALAGIQYWAKAYGAAPEFAMLFNEPLHGNGELLNSDAEVLVDIVKRTGQRLAAANLDSVKLVVPGDETEDYSLEEATAILADAEARSYVGAIAYHTYPYQSVYSYVPNILTTSGAGQPDAGRIAVRRALRDLGAEHGVPVWMTEVSHAYLESDGVDAEDFRILRGRAIHIHDELEYANASAFFGMNSIWDTKSQSLHFGGDGSNMRITEQDTLVLVDQASDKVTITSTGRAIGHFARFVRRGAKRVRATSSDPLVQVTAFRDGATLVLVLINNGAQTKALQVSTAGIKVAAALTGEQSTISAVWQPIGDIVPTTTTSFSLVLPAESVTTLSTDGNATGGSGGNGGNGGSGGSAAAGGSSGSGGAGGSGGTGDAGGSGGNGDVGGSGGSGDAGGSGGGGGTDSDGTGGSGASSGGGGGVGDGGSGPAGGSAGADVTPAPEEESACGCRAVGARDATPFLGLVALAAAWLTSARRRR